MADDQDKEADRRRDDLARRILRTPPQPRTRKRDAAKATPRPVSGQKSDKRSDTR